MKTRILKFLIAIAGLLSVLHTNATIIVSLEPSSQTINVGDSVSINLVVSGLGDHTSPSLGGFGFFNSDLTYDPAILSPNSVAFGTFLDLGIAGSFRFFDLTTPGAIKLDETSLESAAALNAAQPASFTLATLGFTGIGAGLGTVHFTGGSLSDETGFQSLEFVTSAGEVIVNGPTRVPDAGSTAALLLLGVGCLAGFRPNVRRTAV